MNPTPAVTSRPGSRAGRRLGAVLCAAVLALAPACASSDDDDAATTTAPDGATTVAGEAAGVIEFRPLDAGGPQTVGALDNGSIDIGVLFTFAPAIAENDWVALEDDKSLQAADHFVPLIAADKNTDDVGAVIDLVTENLTHDGIMDMVEQVSVDGRNPQDVAAEWLEANEVPGDLEASGELTVGSANFAESELVGRLYAGALEQAGVTVDFKDAIGARQVTMPMMENGELDLMPEFTYSLLAYLDSDAESSNDLDTVVSALTDALPEALDIRAASDVEDVNVYVVTSETAEKYDLTTVSDLANVEDTLTMGGPPECPENAACIPGLESVYGLVFELT